MEVVRREFDMANRYRVTVCTDGINTIQLKFQDEVQDSEVILLAENVIAQQLQAQQEQEYLQQLLDEEQALLNELENGSNQENK